MSTQCVQCNYAMTEPICASCAINEINVWLYEKNIEKNVIKRINKGFKMFLDYIHSLDYLLLPSINTWDIFIAGCIRCDKELHLMCSYCVINKASQIVNYHLKDKGQRRSFNESFNIDLYNYTAQIPNKVAQIRTN